MENGEKVILENDFVCPEYKRKVYVFLCVYFLRLGRNKIKINFAYLKELDLDENKFGGNFLHMPRATSSPTYNIVVVSSGQKLVQPL